MIADTNLFRLAIHGGAGDITSDSITLEDQKKINEVLKFALLEGYNMLLNRGTSLNAVETVIKILEDSGLFNAGRGAYTTRSGEIELDASIMDGSSLKGGGVAGIQNVKNPISLAKKVMEKTPYVLLLSDGALELAKQEGLEQVPSSYYYRANFKEPSNNHFGTVGAVALDCFGNISAGTSTCGTKNKMTGRVGDSPLLGSGTYANEQVGVSCTGLGETFIRTCAAYQVSNMMEYGGYSLADATKKVIHEKVKKIGGEGGMIAIDNKGNISIDWNTPGMHRGFITSDGEIQYGSLEELNLEKMKSQQYKNYSELIRHD